MPDALMIFAAGFGTRMGPLTKHLPKPLLKLGGTTLLDRAIAKGRAAGVSRVVVNAHYRSEAIESAVSGDGVCVSREAPEILDTGGGLLHAAQLLKTQVVYTLNPDALFLGPDPLTTLKPAWKGTGALLLLVPGDQAEMRVGGGDFSIGPEGALSRGGDLVYTGAQIIDTTELADIDQKVFSLNLVWDKLEREGRLFGHVYPGRWCDLGTPEALAHAESLLAGSADA